MPVNLHEKILELYAKDSSEYQYTIHFMTKILQHYMYNELPFKEAKCIPKTYYHKVLSSEKRIWGTLRDNLFDKTRNHSTRYGKASKYRIKAHLVEGEWQEVEYYRTYQQQRRGIIDTTDPLYKNVKRVFDQTTITLPEHLDILENKYTDKYRKKIEDNNMTYKPRKNWVDNLRVTYLDETTNQLAKIKLERNLIEVLNFKNKYWRANRNNTNKRLDTNFTNISNKFREGIKINNHHLKQIDLTNSQPCILANSLLYFKEHFLPVVNDHHQSKSIDTVLDNIQEEILNHPLCKGYKHPQIPTSNGGINSESGFISPHLLNSISPLYLYLMMWGFRDIDSLNSLLYSDDLDLFCQKSINGSLYGYLKRSLFLPSRDVAKHSTYCFLFGYHQDKNYREIFPTVSKLVFDFKNWLHEIENENFQSDPERYEEEIGFFSHKSGKNKFCILLQRIESAIVIDGIYADLVKEYDCLTVHDSFLYYQEEVPVIVRERLADYLPYGFKCKETGDSFDS